MLLGGTNVQASAPESRDLLEQGVADATTFPWGSTALSGIDKVTKYHIDAQIYSNEPIWVMNKAKYAALSPAPEDGHRYSLPHRGGDQDLNASGKVRTGRS
jgi:TRAP-type transport system periplasmic protein